MYLANNISVIKNDDLIPDNHIQNNDQLLITEVEYINLNNNCDDDNETNTFLRDKYKKLKISESLKKGVSCGLLKTNYKIKKEFNENKIEINKNSNNFNTIIPKKYFSPDLNKKKFSNETLKYLKHLKYSQKNLKKSISKLEINKAIIEDEGLKGIKGGLIEENIKNSKLNLIENEKNNLMKKLQNIKGEIDLILEESNKKDKKEIISKFLENFEKNKDEYKNKVLKYEKISKDLKEKMEKDKKITSERREKEFKEKEKEDLERKEKLFIERKEKEHQIFLRRKKEIDNKMEKTKQFINEKFQKTEKDYLFFKNKEKYELEEQKLIDKVNSHKKEFVTKEELISIENKIKEQKKILEEESKEKKRQLKEMWSNRSQLLPIYKSKISKICEEDDKEKYCYDELKKEKMIYFEREKIEYSKNNIPKPIICQNLKKILSEKNKKIDKNNVILTHKNNKKRNEIFYVPPPKTFNRNKFSLSNEITIRKYDDEEVNNLIENKSKKLLKPIQILHPKPEKLPNYLQEFIDKREKENYKIRRKKRINFNSTHIQTGDLFENIQLFKIQSDALDKEVKQKEEFLKLNGGYKNNIKIGNEVSNLLIDSIQNKLDAINKLNGI